MIKMIFKKYAIKKKSFTTLFRKYKILCFCTDQLKKKLEYHPLCLEKKMIKKIQMKTTEKVNTQNTVSRNDSHLAGLTF